MATEIFTHTHEVIDQDPRFVIDPETKEITAGAGNLTLAQHAKGSERFTFYIPEKIVEGHDMALCNYVRIHFQNIDQDTGKKSIGIYEVDDMVVENDSVVLSWLVGGDATRYAGGLIFSIHFGCIAEDGTVVYNFPTLTYSQVTVGATVWNEHTIEEQYPDILAEFEARIAALEKGANVSPEQIQTAVDDYLDRNPVAPGATAEQLAQIQQNADAIEEMKQPVTQIDFSNFDLGYFTETINGEVINHNVTFDSLGRPSTIDGCVIEWGDA